MAALIGAAIVAATFTAPGLPICPTEDSISCYWPADTAGNGRGRSFTSDEHGVVTYTDGRS